MRFIAKIFNVWLPLVLLGACDKPEPRTVVVVCEGDSGLTPEPFSKDTTYEASSGSTPCARACKNLSRLGCPEAWKLPGGRTCVEICKMIGPISSYDPACVEKAQDVSDVRKCPSITCKQ